MSTTRILTLILAPLGSVALSCRGLEQLEKDYAKNAADVSTALARLLRKVVTP